MNPRKMKAPPARVMDGMSSVRVRGCVTLSTRVGGSAWGRPGVRLHASSLRPPARASAGPPSHPRLPREWAIPGTVVARGAVSPERLTAPASLRLGRLRPRREPVEDQVRAGHDARVLALPAPLHHALGVDDDQRAVRDAGRLEEGPECARGLALGLVVGELRDAHTQRLAKRGLRVRLIAGDREDAGAGFGDLVQDLLVDLQLVGTDRAEGGR